MPQLAIEHNTAKQYFIPLTASTLADALGWLSYLRPATDQLQRLDLSHNPLLSLSTASKGKHMHYGDCLSSRPAHGSYV